MKNMNLKYGESSGFKLCITALVFILTICILFSATSHGQKNKKNRQDLRVDAEKSKILVAGDSYYPPYEYVDSDGIFKGFNVDYMNAVAKAADIEIEILPMTWSDAIQALRRGDVRIIQGMTISPERKKEFLFSDSIIINTQAIFVNKDRMDIQSLRDLTGKKVVYQRADIVSNAPDKYPGIETIEVDDQKTAVTYLEHKKADAFIGNRMTGIYTMQRMDYTDRVKIVGDPLFDSSYSIVVSKSDGELLREINRGIRQIKSDGTYDRIYAKWFGEEVYDSSAVFRKALVVLGILFAILTGIVLSFFIWNKALKREVNKATFSIGKNVREKSAIIESIESGIITLNGQGIITDANSFSQKLMDDNGLIGKRYDDTKLFGLIGVNFFEGAKSDIYFRKSYEWKVDEEDSRYVDVAFIPIDAGNETPTTDGYILHLHDFTRDKKMTDTLRQKDKLAALGQLSASIAHEVRNPLTAIKTFIELIPLKIDNPDFRKKIIDILPKEIQRLENLTSMLLDYSKPRDTKLEEVNLNVILEEIYTLMKLNLREKNISFIRPHESCIIMADQHHIKQIFINLISNSIDAIGKDGKICLNVKILKTRCVITLEDDGTGIEEKNLDRIFDPFFTTKTGGSGIGLAVTEQLVLENNGIIQVKSKKGSGTKITLVFQRAEV